MPWPSQDEHGLPPKLSIPNPAAADSWKRNAELVFGEEGFDRIWQVITNSLPEGHWFDISKEDVLEHKRISANNQARFLCTPAKESLIRHRELMLIHMAYAFAKAKLDLHVLLSHGYMEAEDMQIVDACAEEFTNLMPDAYHPFWLGLVRLPHFRIHAQELFLRGNPGFSYLCTGAALYKGAYANVIARMRDCVEDGISEQLLTTRLDALRETLDKRDACPATMVFRTNFGQFLGKREHLWLQARNRARLRIDAENALSLAQELEGGGRRPRYTGYGRSDFPSPAFMGQKRLGRAALKRRRGILDENENRAANSARASNWRSQSSESPEADRGQKDLGAKSKSVLKRHPPLSLSPDGGRTDGTDARASNVRSQPLPSPSADRGKTDVNTECATSTIQPRQSPKAKKRRKEHANAASASSLSPWLSPPRAARKRTDKHVNTRGASLSPLSPSSRVASKRTEEHVNANRASSSSSPRQSLSPAAQRRIEVPIIDLCSGSEDELSIPNGQVSPMLRAKSPLSSLQLSDFFDEPQQSIAASPSNESPNAQANGMRTPSITSDEDVDVSMCTPLSENMRSPPQPQRRSADSEAPHTVLNDRRNAETAESDVHGEVAPGTSTKNVERSIYDSKAPAPVFAVIDRSQQYCMEDFNGVNETVNAGPPARVTVDRAVGPSHGIVVEDPSPATLRPKNEESSKIECAICRCTSSQLHVSTKCGHAFCEACWLICLRDREKCPTCRVPMRANSLVPLKM